MLKEMLPFPAQQPRGKPRTGIFNDSSHDGVFFAASVLLSCISKSLALLISWESIWFPALGLSNLSFYTNIQTSLYWMMD